MDSLEQMLTLALAASRKTVAVVSAADEACLTALKEAREKGIVGRASLIGPAGAIREKAAAAGFDLAGTELVDCADPAEMAGIGTRLVAAGQADMLVKGHVETPVLLRAVLARDGGLRLPGSCVASVAAMEIPGLERLVFMSDPGLIPEPTLEQKAAMIRGITEKLHILGYAEPKIGVVCSAETVNPKIKCMVEAAELQRMNETGVLPGCLVAGPISFDLALSEAAVRVKGYSHPVGGRADVLIMPNIEAANAAQKALINFAHAKQGGFFIGLKAPVVISSRADTVESKLYALAFASLLAGAGEV